MSVGIKLFESKADCCGCGACYNVCPQQAIHFKKDEYGFTFPTINRELCIECGACNKVCPMQNDSGVSEPQTVYAAALNDSETKKKSASGGVFAGIAKFILSQGGVVYGAAYGDNQYVHHIGITEEKELYRLQDSKYVQSDTEKIYSDVKEKLLKGKLVLFSGTPCQVAGLKLYLRKDYINLYTIDLICHGVPSYQMFYDGMKAVIGNDEQIKHVSFRDKTNGWGTDGYIRTDKRRYSIDESRSSYYYYFLNSMIYRDSCYHCKYASDNRPGDFTIGDYWRIETAHPEYGKTINEREGVSCLLINSDKGKDLFNAVQNNFALIESIVELVKARNGRLNRCESMPAFRSELLELYKEKGYRAVNEYWTRHECKGVLFLRMKEFIRPAYKAIRKIISRLSRG